jgi:hypothetical protein
MMPRAGKYPFHDNYPDGPMKSGNFVADKQHMGKKESRFVHGPPTMIATLM